MEPAANERIDTLLAELDRLTADLSKALFAVEGQASIRHRRGRRQVKRIGRQITHNAKSLRGELGRARRRSRSERRLFAGQTAAGTARDIASLADEFSSLIDKLDLMGQGGATGARSVRERAHVIALDLEGQADLTKGRPELPWNR